MGPGAGVHGGEVVGQGEPQDLKRINRSITGRYLCGEMQVPVPAQRRATTDKFLLIRGAREHNLKNITVKIPVGAMTCVTGVSGAGKSTLVMNILYREVARRLGRSQIRAGGFETLEGWENFTRVVGIDQAPIGRTPRSNPATPAGDAAKRAKGME
jgi:excinuclease ABC subunit A